MSQAVATPSHLWRHTACRIGMACGGRNLMNGSNHMERRQSSVPDDCAAVPPVTTGRSGKIRHRLKQTLRDNQDVAWLKRDIARYVTIPDQVSKMHRVSGLRAVGGADDDAVVPCRISGEPADRDHRVEHGHVRAIGKRAWLCRFADDAHLVGDRTNEARDDDGDKRLGLRWSDPRPGPTKPETMTVTSGSRMYLPSRCSYSRARAVGVLPIATTSSTSGIETRPSGRTGTVTVSSGLRQTKMFKLSPGPIRYSAEGSEEAGGAGGSSGAPPHPAIDNTAAANKAPKPVRCTFRPRPAIPTRMNIGPDKCSPQKL